MNRRVTPVPAGLRPLPLGHPAYHGLVRVRGPSAITVHHVLGALIRLEVAA
jgi:hypothetical protein